MYRHSARIQDMIGKIIPLLAAVLMIAFAVMPAYAVKSQDSKASSVQKAKSQIRALTAEQTLSAVSQQDVTGAITDIYPQYKDYSGEKIPLDYQVKERDVENYEPAYSQSRHQTKVDSSSVHLFVPAEELKEGGKYYIVSSSDSGQQKVYKGEAYQTEKVLSAQMTISEGKIKDKDGNTYLIVTSPGTGSVVDGDIHTGQTHI